MQALLLADTLRDKHSIAEIPHGCAEATYVELLAGRPIQDVGERAALTLDCEDGLMMLGDGGAASDELPAKRARREPPDPEGRGGARRQAAAATLDEWEGGLGLTSPEPESETHSHRAKRARAKAREPESQSHNQRARARLFNNKHRGMDSVSASASSMGLQIIFY